MLFQLVVSNLFKRGCLQYANLADPLLGVIYEIFFLIAPKWHDIPKVFTYRHSEEFYTENFCLIKVICVTRIHSGKLETALHLFTTKNFYGLLLN